MRAAKRENITQQQKKKQIEKWQHRDGKKQSLQRPCNLEDENGEIAFFPDETAAAGEKSTTLTAHAAPP